MSHVKHIFSSTDKSTCLIQTVERDKRQCPTNCQMCEKKVCEQKQIRENTGTLISHNISKKRNNIFLIINKNEFINESINKSK